MLEYTGQIQIDATERFGYADITPPYRDGYGYKISSIAAIFSGTDTANANDQVLFGISTKAPARTTYLPASEDLPSDILIMGSVFYVTGGQEILNLDCCHPGIIALRVEDRIFRTTCRIFVATNDVVATDKELNCAYRIRVEEFKLSNAAKDSLLSRSCGS